MDKVICINSASSQDPQNFSVIVPPLTVAPHSQICMTHFQGQQRYCVNIDETNDTLFWTTGKSYKSDSTDTGIRPVEVKIKHGSYYTAAHVHTQEESICRALQVALNNAPTTPPLYIGGWSVSALTAGVATMKLEPMTGARTDACVDVASTFQTLQVPGFEGDDWVYTGTPSGPDTSNGILTGPTPNTGRAVVSNKIISGPVSDSAAIGATKGGMCFTYLVPAGEDPIEYCQGFFGIIREDSIHKERGQNDRFFVRDDKENGTRGAVDHSTGLAIPNCAESTLNDINMFFHAGYYVGNDGFVYVFKSTNEDEHMRFDKTAIQLTTDAVNSRTYKFDLRWLFDTDKYKIRFMTSGEITGQPDNYVITDTYECQSWELTTKFNTFIIDGSTPGENDILIDGDYYDPDNKKTASNAETNMGLTLFLNRATIQEKEEQHIDYFGNILNKANFSNTWGVDILRYSENDNLNIQYTTTSYSVGIETGNFNNAPQQKLYLINCPSLPLQNAICNPTNRNVISTIGVYHSDYNKQVPFENWISLDNPDPIAISNLQFYISDVYGKPTTDFENSVSFLIKFRREPHHHQKSLMKEQAILFQELSRNLGSVNKRKDQIL